jgi:hypothetical protein
MRLHRTCLLRGRICWTTVPRALWLDQWSIQGATVLLTRKGSAPKASVSILLFAQ